MESRPDSARLPLVVAHVHHTAHLDNAVVTIFRGPGQAHRTSTCYRGWRHSVARALVDCSAGAGHRIWRGRRASPGCSGISQSGSCERRSAHLAVIPGDKHDEHAIRHRQRSAM